jgi:hypothetical protein
MHAGDVSGMPQTAISGSLGLGYTLLYAMLASLWIDMYYASEQCGKLYDKSVDAGRTDRMAAKGINCIDCTNV